MPIAIAFIMFGVGINLRFVDFKHTFNRPKAVITGLAAQMILLPIMAFIINLFLYNRSDLQGRDCFDCCMPRRYYLKI